MSRKRAAIPDTAGVLDPKVRRILDAMKETIEVLTGERGRREDQALSIAELREAMISAGITNAKNLK